MTCEAPTSDMATTWPPLPPGVEEQPGFLLEKPRTSPSSLRFAALE